MLRVWSTEKIVGVGPKPIGLHSHTFGPNRTVVVVVDSRFTAAVRRPRIEDIARTDRLEFAVNKQTCCALLQTVLSG